MDPKLVDLINSIADKLGLAATQLLPELVRAYMARAIVDSIQSVILLAIGVLAIVLATKWWLRLHQNRDHDFAEAKKAAAGPFDHVSSWDYDTMGYDICFAVVLIAALVTCLVAFIALGNDISFLVTPEGSTALKLLGK